MATILFYLFAGLAIGGAIGVVMAKSPVGSLLFMVTALGAMAGTFVLMEAHFLAAIQIIVYAGAIMVLFLFVIMLLGVDRAEDLSIEPLKLQRPVAIVLGAGVTVLLAGAVVRGADTLGSESVASAPGDSNIRALARSLYSDHVLAFELTSVLLIVAVAGTVVLTRRLKRSEG